jgi:hypothetical protein
MGMPTKPDTTCLSAATATALAILAGRAACPGVSFDLLCAAAIETGSEAERDLVAPILTEAREIGTQAKAADERGQKLYQRIKELLDGASRSG